MNYISLFILIWIFCGMVNILYNNIENRFSRMDQDTRDKWSRDIEIVRRYYGNIVVWLAIIVVSIFYGPIGLFRSWNTKRRENANS